jgi:hypothetical protein
MVLRYVPGNKRREVPALRVFLSCDVPPSLIALPRIHRLNGAKSCEVSMKDRYLLKPES